jgi:FixJ family two-component response regulator
MARNLISVVDDDESICRSTSLLIKSFGYRAAAFASAESFLNSPRLHETSCVILDVQLPGMNGLQLQIHLTAEGCGIPIIFITAYDDKESCRQAMQTGAVAFLCKPFSDDQSLLTILSALRHDESAKPRRSDEYVNYLAG